MMDAVKRIGEFAKEYNEIVETFHKITPTSMRIEEVYKPFDCLERELYDEDGCWIEEEIEYNTEGDIVSKEYPFPDYKEFEMRAEVFGKDCDYLILNEKDDILISFAKMFNYPQIYPTAEQFANAQMYNEQILLDIIWSVWSIVKDYKEGHGLFYDAIEERRNVLLQTNVQIEDKKEVLHRKREETGTPPEFDDEQAKEILKKAINAGLCDNDYKWLKTKSLLAYFADRVSEYLKLGKGEYDGKAKTSWKPFEILFGISGLSGAKRDFQKTGTLPDGHKDVDNLFE